MDVNSVIPIGRTRNVVPRRRPRNGERDPRDDSVAGTLSDRAGCLCINCGARIPRKRLLAAPATRRCRECQLAHENGSAV
ncbi:MAG: TraR/DksA C4-type zinc finger protein [Phycisphaerae bacterium]